jgi:hypothetical protein
LSSAISKPRRRGRPRSSACRTAWRTRAALRRFPNDGHLAGHLPRACPGERHRLANLGLAEVGRYPEGGDEPSELLSASRRAAPWASRPVLDVMRWKYTKLLDNLSNAAQVVVGLAAGRGEVAARAGAEGAEVLKAARINRLPDPEMAPSSHRGDHQQGGQRARAGRRFDPAERAARGGDCRVRPPNGEIVLIGPMTSSLPCSIAKRRLSSKGPRRCGKQVAEESGVASAAYGHRQRHRPSPRADHQTAAMPLDRRSASLAALARRSRDG